MDYALCIVIWLFWIVVSVLAVVILVILGALIVTAYIGPDEEED